MARPFVPVIHAAVPDRPDEQDTVDTTVIIAEALRRLGCASEVVDIGTDFSPLVRLAARRPGAVFNLVEAVGGDCARAPQPVRLMEQLGLRYTGATAAACELTASKVGAKAFLAARRVPTPRWWGHGTTVPARLTAIVKSDSEHASLGIDAASVVPGNAASAEIARREARFGGTFFAEEFIEGREFNVALIDSGGGRAEVLPIPEIRFDGLPAGRPHIVDYEAKWDAGSHAYHHTPRRFGLEAREPALAAELGRLARAAWDACGLTGYARVDFRVDAAGRPLVLEVNTNPCLAPDAGFFATAVEAGLSFDAMIARILHAARKRVLKAA